MYTNLILLSMLYIFLNYNIILSRIFNIILIVVYKLMKYYIISKIPYLMKKIHYVPC